jgi:hypothetical protein
MPNNVHAVPATERERRMRYVRMCQVELGEIDPPAAECPTPKHVRAAARKRAVELLALEAGLPLPDWSRHERGKAEPIDVASIKAAWNELQRDRLSAYAEYGVTLQNHGRRASCRRCGHVLLDVPNGMVGVTPSALYVMHAQATDCR